MESPPCVESPLNIKKIFIYKLYCLVNYIVDSNLLYYVCFLSNSLILMFVLFQILQERHLKDTNADDVPTSCDNPLESGSKVNVYQSKKNMAYNPPQSPMASGHFKLKERIPQMWQFSAVPTNSPAPPPPAAVGTSVLDKDSSPCPKSSLKSHGAQALTPGAMTAMEDNLRKQAFANRRKDSLLLPSSSSPIGLRSASSASISMTSSASTPKASTSPVKKRKGCLECRDNNCTCSSSVTTSPTKKRKPEHLSPVAAEKSDDIQSPVISSSSMEAEKETTPKSQSEASTSTTSRRAWRSWLSLFEGSQACPV